MHKNIINYVENNNEGINRLCKLHELIKKEETGTPQQLADSLQISRSYLYKVIGKLNDYGAKIKYDRTRHTFYYKESFKITLCQIHLESV
jgi:predicted DNA-binding transcriptional regulator YafY